MSSLSNFIAGEWVQFRSEHTRPVHNPASAEVHDAIAAAHKAFPGWRRIPFNERVRFLFRLKTRLEEDFDELSKTITLEGGRTLAESRGELRRAIENIEVACSATVLTQGLFSEDIAPGIDEFTIRQPLGVCAIIAPFNFPGMIPFWFLPYALVAGNTVVLKPSERVPLTMTHVFRILEKLRFSAGVVNLVNGAREAGDTLLDDERVQAASFDGSSAAGKRVQCHGGAKNPIVIAADAHLDSTTQAVAGCAGQRCHAAATPLTGFGMDAVQMGPVISAESETRIQGLIAGAESEGATVTVDGRDANVSGFEKGFFLKPTILEGLPLGGAVASTEIFGPVLSLHEAEDLGQALAIINQGQYGNMACLFTSSGDLHGQGRDAFQFFTKQKVVVERWPLAVSRLF